MNSPREKILSRLSAGLTPEKSAPRLPPRDIDHWPMERRLSKFRERMEAVRTEVYLENRADWTGRLMRISRDKGLQNLLYAPAGPLGDAIEKAWQGGKGLPPLVEFDNEIAEWKHSLFYEVAACVTSTHGGIAETGTLVLWPDREEPRSYSLIPPIHIAVLDSAVLYSRFIDLMRDQGWQRGLPSNALLISGPSKTADIEQTLSYGIHGPTELIVIVLT